MPHAPAFTSVFKLFDQWSKLSPEEQKKITDLMTRLVSEQSAKAKEVV